VPPAADFAALRGELELPGPFAAEVLAEAQAAARAPGPSRGATPPRSSS